MPISPPSQTAVIYCRYSSERQHETSIEAQREAITAYAAARGIQIVQEYVDRAMSARSDRRPAFLQMVSDLARRPVDLVLVHKIDRFARNRYDAAVYARQIERAGARLVSITQDFGAGPESIILDGLMQAMAEYYSANLSTEVIKGRKLRVRAGRHAGGTYPFGYKPDGRGKYAIDEGEAYFVRKLYACVLSGTPFTRVIEEMAEAGVTGRRGALLKSGNVSRMLRDPVYMGVYAEKAGDVSAYIVGNHPAIIDRQTYEEAVRIMDEKMNVGRAGRRPYPCSGITVCGLCGNRLNGHTSRSRGHEYPSYACNSGKACSLRSVPAAELEAIACDYVNHVLTSDIRADLAKSLRAYIAGQARASARRSPEIDREIAQLRREIEALTKNLASGVLPVSVVSKLGEQIEQKQQRISLLTELRTKPPALDELAIDEYFDAATVSLSDDPAHLKRTFRRFIARIVVYQDTIEIVSTFDGWLSKHSQGIPELRALAALPPLDDDDDDPEGGPDNGRSSPSPGSPPVSSPRPGSPRPSAPSPNTGSPRPSAPNSPARNPNSPACNSSAPIKKKNS